MEYLAIPYSHPDPAVMEERFEIANRVAADLMRQGRIIFSPISHSHPIAQYGLPVTWDYWLQYDREIISYCSKLVVIMLPGWRRSRGVNAEIALAIKFGIEIELIDPPKGGE